LPIFARTVLHVGSLGFGLLMGAIGLGAVVAALLLPGLKRRWPLERLILFATLVFAASLLGAGTTARAPTVSSASAWERKVRRASKRHARE
jgi:predicted MFS family arabinose efflux permease